ncbi:MAG TPA: hypothetical protein VNO30_27005 [Kofleriaceae bacterium]|nr:hypothetical protein [Kofleriaceae bacterium]
MKAWLDLYQQHRDGRSGSTDLGTALRRRLLALAERGHCHRTIQGRFTRHDGGPRRELYIQPLDPNDPVKGEPLVDLPLLVNARLTVLALLSKKKDHVHQFTAMIEGTTRVGARWAAAVHLEEDYATPHQDRKGSGACGHAAFHCHVGPTLDDEPKVRLPLPAVGPADALDWLLSIVVPTWEPAPWPAVVAALPVK